MPGNRLTLCMLTALLLVSLHLSSAVAASKDIRAGLEQNPPLSFIDENGKPAGLLVEILDHIAVREGWRIIYVPDTFQRCLEKLRNHDIDLMVTIAFSEERARLYDFNRTNVVANWAGLYTPKGKEIQSYFELEGLKVAVMRKDIHHKNFSKLLESFNISVDYLERDDFVQVFEALDANEADAGVVSRFYALANEEKYAVQSTPLIFSPIQVHYATAKGTHQELLAAIDRNLEELKANNESVYYQALDHWLGVGAKATRFPEWARNLLYGLAALLVLLLSFVYTLRRQVAIKTRSLSAEMTQRLHAQSELQSAEEKYRRLVELANAIILHWDTQGEITFINDYGERLFGFGKGELLGRNVSGTIVPDTETTGRDLSGMIYEICEKPEDFLANENENICKDGRRIWISWYNRAVRGPDNRLQGIISVGIDVTDSKLAALARQEYDKAKDAFISTAAHELRTPLTAIIGYAELLNDALTTGCFTLEQQQDFLNIIRAKGDVLDRTVDDLLDISRIAKGVPLPLQRKKESITRIAEQVIAQMQTLYTDHPLELKSILAQGRQISLDANRITQVFENLLSNAVKYSPAGSPVEVTLYEERENIIIRVMDQGLGMTEEQRRRAFDNFYRVDTQNSAVSGLGIGLGITRQIVLAHGGNIEIDSAPGEGTTVCVSLPLKSGSHAQPTKLNPAASEDEGSGQGNETFVPGSEP